MTNPRDKYSFRALLFTLRTCNSMSLSSFNPSLMILLIIALIALIIGTYTDIKTREVPDWLNYSLIFIGLGGRLIFSLVKFDFSYLIEGLLGFVLFLVLAGFGFLTLFDITSDSAMAATKNGAIPASETWSGDIYITGNVFVSQNRLFLT